MGWISVALRKLFRPLLRAPLGDLFERQRVFNLLQMEEQIRTRRRLEDYERRLASMEALVREGLDEVCRYNDALHSRVDAKVDEALRDSARWQDRLRSALDSDPPAGIAEPAPGVDPQGVELPSARVRELATLVRDASYTSFEDRFRGPREEILARLRFYEERLAASGPVFDLGCGRGELLEMLAEHGTTVRGVDGNAEMVRLCQEAGLDVHRGDLLEELAGQPPGEWGCVCAFHVIEHLEAAERAALVSGAFAALRPGGLLVLETPSALSVAAGRDFWIDATHVRPAHPRQLEGLALAAGFESVELHNLQPFPVGERLGEVSLDDLEGEAREVANRVNRVRDQLDELLFGYRDVAVIARKASS